MLYYNIISYLKIYALRVKWIPNAKNFIDHIQFHLICQILLMLTTFSGVESERLKKEKREFCVVFTYPQPIKQAHGIRKFHVTVMQWRLRNLKKGMMHMQSCCFANINLLLFCYCCPHCHCLSSHLLWSTNFATLVTWCHTSLLHIHTS